MKEKDQQTSVGAGKRKSGGNPETHVALPGSMRSMRPGAKVLGVADPDEWIEVTIKVRRKKALPEPGMDVSATANSSQPAAKNSSQPAAGPLTLKQLEEEYGANPADIEKVQTVLTGLGMQILKEDALTCTVRAGARAEVMESVFQVRLFHYSHSQGNYRGRRGDLRVPAELKDIIVAVLGLDNRRMVKRRPIRRRKTSLDLADRAAAGRTWFFPAELATIYSFPAGDGQGQTVGLLEFGGGFFADDLATFCQNANVAVPTVRTVSVNNTPTNQRDGAEGEVMLDVEVVVGVCPAAAIVVYFSSFDESGWVDIVDTAIHDQDNPLTVISCSWGYAEDAPGAWSAGAQTAINDALQAATLLGITVCVAAGDDGSDDEVGDGHAHVDFPSSSPYVLAVGGTTLKRSASGAITETAWKDGDGLRKDNGGSTGGGVSTIFPRPSWQTISVPSVNPASIQGRVVPDVAADASANTGYWTVVDGQGGASGGTSAAAPLWASLIARLNAAVGSPVGFLGPSLYRTGSNGKPLGQTGCRDITSGNNDTASIGGYSAGPGFDAVTGWGVPIGTALLSGLKK